MNSQAPKTVLFACVHDAARSQMAAAFFKVLVSPNVARGVSAGTQPGDPIHPEVMAVMRELGIDLANVKPQLLTPELAGKADLLVTMGCGETCPVVPGLRRVDWDLPDPKGQPIEQVRAVRDQIRDHVFRLIGDNAWDDK